MLARPFLSPIPFGTEMIYTVIIVLFFFLVYYKTREIYNLTKYKGIQFFRYAFLFFGLAYASRLFLHLFFLGNNFMTGPMGRGTIMPLSNLLVAYLSTMAILYLMYSTVWKKINVEHFLISSNIVALLIAVTAFISRNPMMVSLIQSVLLAITVIISFRMHKAKRKNTRILYLLVALFWLINLFVLGPKMFMPFGFKIVFQVLSLFVFAVIYYKVHKWIR